MKKIALLSFLALVITGSQLLGQGMGELSGVIKDSISGETLPNAYIMLKQNDEMRYQAGTDINGKYDIGQITPGTYQVTISFTGYTGKQFTREIKSGVMTFQDMELVPGVALRVVHVRPPLLDIGETTDADRLTAEDFQHGGLKTIGDAVATAENVHARDNGAIHISGSRDDANLVILDGVRMTGSIHIPTNAISEFNVISHGFPAKYGDFTGGVIEIYTKSYFNH